MIFEIKCTILSHNISREQNIDKTCMIVFVTKTKHIHSINVLMKLMRKERDMIGILKAHVIWFKCCNGVLFVSVCL